MTKFLREQWYMLVKTHDMPESRMQYLLDEASRLDNLNINLGKLILSTVDHDIRVQLANYQYQTLRKWHQTCMALDLDYNVNDMGCDS